MRTVGSLFSGIGGFDKGLEDTGGFKVVWQVENNEYCRQVLRKHWPTVPCHYDITAIDWRDVPAVDLVCGGFPCQPFSVAGKRAGTADDRYLWPEVVRCLEVVRPTWFLGENVPGLITMALDQVCTDLEGLGYAVWPVCLPACAVDAPHKRERLWIIARQNEAWRCATDDCFPKASLGEIGDNAVFPDPLSLGQQEQWKSVTSAAGGIVGRMRAEHSRGWPTEPAICRVADGVQNRVGRLKGLGNAVVPQIVEALGRMILDCEEVSP